MGFTPVFEPLREIEIPENWLMDGAAELAREIDRDIIRRLLGLGEEQRERVIPINVPQSPFNPYNPYQPQQPPPPFTAPWSVPNPYTPFTGNNQDGISPYHQPWRTYYITSTGTTLKN